MLCAGFAAGLYDVYAEWRQRKKNNKSFISEVVDIDFKVMQVKAMYAIAFDLRIDDLKREYGEPYNRAYDEIRQELEKLGFEWTQGSVYINHAESDTLTTVYKAITRLSKIDWFKNSVRDIRAFKVEDWSDFTGIVKGLE